MSWLDGSNRTALFLFGLTTGITVSATLNYIANHVVPIFFPSMYKSTNRIQPSSATAAPQAALVRSPAIAIITDSVSMARLEKDFTITAAMLQRIVKHFVAEMRKGLAADGNTLKMIPTFVENLPKGNETGTVLALDMGGTNFRVCEVTLETQGRVRMRQKKYTISDELKTGTGEKLFDFFADCVYKFLEELGTDPFREQKLGFTFSFPVQQSAINRGYLMYWNKGFTASNVIGVDVVSLLQSAFLRRNMHITVSALVNDTVGTLMAHAYSDPQTYVGVILGTGTNAAYVEATERVPKWTGTPPLSGHMIINTEWGAFDNEMVVLPVTKYDGQLDRASPNPGSQVFEKMLSGMYLGEVVRYAILDLVSTGELFRGKSSKEIEKPYHFETAYMSRIERDHTIELSDTKSVLEDLLHLPATSINDRRIVKRICELVGIRSARLSAAGVAAVVTKINRLDGCTVAIDGSLFEHYPHFANRMRDALRELLGLTADNVVLELARDGSGQGAALIAKLHS